MRRIVLHEPFFAGVRRDVVIEDGIITEIGRGLRRNGDTVVDCTDRWITPALLDLHAHLREPGHEHKEDVETACRAAIAGGFGAICAMPNTVPAPDSPGAVGYVLRRAAEVGRGVQVLVAAAATLGNQCRMPADYAALRDAGCAMVSDDACTIEDEGLLRECLARSAEAGLPFSSHRELPGDNGQLEEPRAIERACESAIETGARLHVAHVSTAEGARLVLDARAAGAAVTWEVCPHHLLLTAADVARLGTLAKVNPRLKTAEDCLALRAHALAGELDAFATDHAPHAASEKAGPFDTAPAGMTGLECALPVTHRALWEERSDPDAWNACVRLWTEGPWSVLGRDGPSIAVGNEARLAVFEFGRLQIGPGWLHSRSTNCPYIGLEVRCRPVLTVLGRRAWGRDSVGRLFPLGGE